MVVAYGNSDAGAVNFYINFNGDTASHYIYQQIYSFDSSAGHFVSSGLTGQPAICSSSGTAVAAWGGSVDFILPNYAGTTFYKTAQSAFQFRNSSTSETLSTIGVVWQSTSAITSITIGDATGNIIAGSTFTVYGIP